MFIYQRKLWSGVWTVEESKSTWSARSAHSLSHTHSVSVIALILRRHKCTQNYRNCFSNVCTQDVLNILFSFSRPRSPLRSHSHLHSHSTSSATIYIFATLEFMYEIHLDLRQYWLAICPFMPLHWIAVTQLDFDKKMEKKIESFSKFN